MSLQKESEKKIITAMGMMAENMQRQALGESMAYTESDFVNLLEDHKCGGELCVVCGYREKIKESEWEEQLKRLQMALYVSVPADVAEDACKRINTIITAAVSNREKEIAEEVEKLKRETLHEKHNEESQAPHETPTKTCTCQHCDNWRCDHKRV